MIAMQDFHSFLRLYGVNYDVRKRSQGKLSRAIPVTGSAEIRCGSQHADTLINRPHSRLSEVGIVPFKV